MEENRSKNLNVYNRTQKEKVTTGNSRDTDARALLACAKRMHDAKQLMADDQKSKENLKLYGEAIRHNQRLWTIFQVAIADPENPLPENLKVILLNLSRYIDKTSFKAVGKYTPELVDSLININRIISTGLSKPPAEGTPTTMPSVRQDVPTSLITSA